MTAALLTSQEHEVLDATPTRRIPAWKKLGLKLKFANEQVERLPRLDSKIATNKKRARAENSDESSEAITSECKVKKRPRLIPPNPSTVSSTGSDLKVLSPSLKRESSGTRKKVSFTSDTKVDDGDSSKSLIADWEAQYDQPPLPASSPTDSKAPKEKLGKAKKSKSPSATERPHAALAYLTLFCQAKGSWKFNKGKDIWILKHLFSLDDIPPEHDIALSQYIRGLKASAARARIAQQAQDTVEKDQVEPINFITAIAREDSTTKAGALPTDMEDPARRRAYYEDSVRRYKRKLEAHLDDVVEDELNWVSPERLAKRRRAEITLWALGVTPPSAETLQSTDTTDSERSASCNGTSTRGRILQSEITQKKRKNRTCVVELSSSSEETSSSDSDNSGSDSEGGEQSDAQTERTGIASDTSATESRTPSQDPSADSGTGSGIGSSTVSNAEQDSGAKKRLNRVPSRRQPSIISISS